MRWGHKPVLVLQKDCLHLKNNEFLEHLFFSNYSFQPFCHIPSTIHLRPGVPLSLINIHRLLEIPRQTPETMVPRKIHRNRELARPPRIFSCHGLPDVLHHPPNEIPNSVPPHQHHSNNSHRRILHQNLRQSYELGERRPPAGPLRKISQQKKFCIRSSSAEILDKVQQSCFSGYRWNSAPSFGHWLETERCVLDKVVLFESCY